MSVQLPQPCIRHIPYTKFRDGAPAVHMLCVFETNDLFRQRWTEQTQPIHANFAVRHNRLHPWNEVRRLHVPAYIHQPCLTKQHVLELIERYGIPNNLMQIFNEADACKLLSRGVVEELIVLQYSTADMVLPSTRIVTNTGMFSLAQFHSGSSVP